MNAMRRDELGKRKERCGLEFRAANVPATTGDAARKRA
jgi:hypothetical protein